MTFMLADAQAIEFGASIGEFVRVASPIVLFGVAVALVFDFINGFHDAANSVATIVSTRVLSPQAAVVWAAFFNFVAFLLFEAAVASNIAKGVDARFVSENVILATLFGAIIWNLITWYYGIPSSSSHALMGAFAGAGLLRAFMETSSLSGVINVAVYQKTAAFIFVAPVLGGILGFTIMKAVRLAFRAVRPRYIDKVFRVGQLFSAAAYSLGHGGNDAQKTMGIIMALMVAEATIVDPTFVAPDKIDPHLWVVLTCHLAMGLGTLSGGWRIVKTMGMKITKLKPVGGFAAETGGAIMLFGATHLGIPVSTTHTITGAIMGTGAATGRLNAVRWGVAGRIVIAWVITIPAAAGAAAASYFAIQLITGIY